MQKNQKKRHLNTPVNWHWHNLFQWLQVSTMQQEANLMTLLSSSKFLHKYIKKNLKFQADTLPAYLEILIGLQKQSWKLAIQNPLILRCFQGCIFLLRSVTPHSDSTSTKNSLSFCSSFHPLLITWLKHYSWAKNCHSEIYLANHS